MNHDALTGTEIRRRAERQSRIDATARALFVREALNGYTDEYEDDADRNNATYADQSYRVAAALESARARFIAEEGK